MDGWQERFVEISTKQAEISQTLRAMVDDHEKRIRVIERLLSYGIGALGLAKIIWDVAHK